MPDSKQKLVSFLEKYPTRTFQKGEIIVFQGEAPRYSFVVKSGVVKSYNLSAHGDEKPIEFVSTLGLFPAPWVFHKAPSAFFYFEAFTECILYCVPREEYLDFVKNDATQLFTVLEDYMTQHIGSTMRFNALQHSRASDKLLYTLHYLTLTHGRIIGPNVTEIMLNLTHQDFANLTGLTRETTATELNKLKTKGVISYGKHTLYRVKLNKLREAINDEFIAEMELKA
jgi:CRP/FNR family transcriptional regulator